MSQPYISDQDFKHDHHIPDQKSGTSHARRRRGGGEGPSRDRYSTAVPLREGGRGVVWGESASRRSLWQQAQRDRGRGRGDHARAINLIIFS